MRTTPLSELLDTLKASVAICSDGTASVIHDFTEQEPVMTCSFHYKFEGVPLIVGADSPLSGEVDLMYDADGDWSIVGIYLTSDDPAGSAAGRLIAVDRTGALYQHIASRIEIHCREDIDSEVGDVMAERRDEGRRMLAAE